MLWQGIVSVDQEKMEVTVRAGTTLSELNVLLEDHGLAVRILGSISDQTVGGAISTGKYGILCTCNAHVLKNLTMHIPSS